MAIFRVRLARLFVWVAFFGVAAQASAFQGGTARITGLVRLPPGETQNPDIVRVILSTVNGGFVQGITLHAETQFVFERIGYGQYIVQVESPGFESGSQWVDINAPYRNQEVMVIVALGPRSEPSARQAEPEPSQSTIDVQTLSIPPKAFKELERAEKEAARGNARKAIEHFEKASRECPDCVQPYDGLAMQHAALGDFDKAIAVFEKSIQLNPENPKTLRNLSQLLLSRGRYQDALDHLNAAATQEPNHSKTFLLLGEANLGLGDCDMALDYFRAAIEIDPADHSYLGFGQCYLQQGRAAEAVLELRGFLEHYPQDPRAEGVKQFLQQLEQEPRK